MNWTTCRQRRCGKFWTFRFLTVRLEGRPALVYDEQVLAQLYAESEEEDRMLAEAGMADYALGLADEDTQ